MSDGLNMLDRAQEPETSFPGAGKPAGGLLAVGALSMPDTGGPGPHALQEPAAWVYDFDPATGTSRASFNGEVTFLTGGSATAGVTSWNGQTGAVVMQPADVQAAGGIVNPSAALTGVPTVPTAAQGTSSTQIASTAFVAQSIASTASVSSFNGRVGAVTLTTGDVTGVGGAPAASPALTGTPTTPTASPGNASSQIASTMFVQNAIAGETVSSFNGRQGTVALSLSDVLSVGGAPINSPTFTGVPLVPTASPGTATTQAASTAFVTNAVTGATAGVASVNTRTGAVVLNAADLTAMGGAPLNAPTFTGGAHAPTPSAGDNSTLIATTAFVDTAIGSLPAGVATFNGRTGTVTLNLTDVTNVGGAPLASPTFTGSPLTTTPTPGDNSTRVADTAFVTGAIGALVIPGPSTITPLMNGTAAIGTSALFARADHVHPTDTTRAAATALANYLPLAGGTMTGNLTALGVAASNINVTGNITIGGSTQTANNAYFAYPTVADFLATASPPNRQIQFTAGSAVNVNSNTGTFQWTWSSTMMFQCDPAGNFTIAGANAIKPGGGPWASTSDARIKTVLGDYTLGLDEVLQLDPVTFVYKGNDAPPPPDDVSPNAGVAEAQRQFVGLIAQDVEPIFPDMVTQGPGWIDGEAVDDMRTLDTTELIFALVNAVKTLNSRVLQLEAALHSGGMG